MTDVDSLRAAIEQYESQLSQVQLALSGSTAGADRDNLQSLQSDIQELIALTKESLRSAEGKETSDNEDDGLSDDSQDNDDDDDPMAKEYAMFKAELRDDGFNNTTTHDNGKYQAPNNDNNIDEELKSLEGMKCRAPFGRSWGGTGYHNAMVSSVLQNDEQPTINSINDIQVKVLFINPTHKEMLPCAYYLDGKCKFSDEKCHYSHGEKVAFSSLQEYREPDYSSIKMASRVLAKEKNNIWHRSVILKTPSKDHDLYRVKFEASGNIIEVTLADLVPLTDDQLDMSDSSDDDLDDDSTKGFNLSIDKTKEDIMIEQSLLTLNYNEPLGKWEEHTRGIGSKLMLQMGYILGTGLGKRADGRVEPVEATVLPPGKSLDHCMELRENAAGDNNLFTVERRLLKQKHKIDQQFAKQSDNREKKQRGKDIFDFINNSLSDKHGETSEASSSSKCKNSFRAATNRGLNVANFQVGENITKLERESLLLMNSLRKHAKGSIPYNNIVIQYNDKQAELTNLRSQQKNIVSEQNHRKDKTKLSVF
ncbi:zinc finger CCCH-type with G patch domain-containing protein [Diachasma alloeum]|uniref:zinc finger CCCH-type with G patch domain-containing protein n=1 Tax=Diachasma alloeum TaxID=454923 RepID=UPI00073840A1|nr:zinc finger CCCH-type with G patch domain-containing protein [Diachasma alloeum]